MAALTGPIPKRDEQRAGHTTKAESEAITKIRMEGEVQKPDLRRFPGQITHPVARGFWDSLEHSGQAVYWEPSDWMVALTALSLLDKQLWADKKSPTMIAACWQMLSSIAVTEGERRRLRLEVERKPRMQESEAKVIPISEVVRQRLEQQQA